MTDEHSEPSTSADRNAVLKDNNRKVKEWKKREEVENETGESKDATEAVQKRSGDA